MMARRAAGAWSFLGGCVLVVGGALAAMQLALPLYPPAAGSAAAMYDRAADKRIATWGAGAVPRGGVRGVVFGDSVWAPNDPDRQFAGALETALQEFGLPVSLLNLTHAGFGAYQFYYLGSRVLGAGPPDFAVVEVNLFTFAPDWYGEPLGRFSPMAAGLSPAQVWRVREALATQQIGLLSPLLYRLDARFGVLTLFDRVRVFGVESLDAIGDRLNGALGLAVPSAQSRYWAKIQQHVQLTPTTAQRWYGREFVSSPTAQVLRAFSDDLRAAGVTILYVVSPVQRRTLQAFGVAPADLQARVERLREMLGASAAEWVETAGLFESSEFIDGVHVHKDLISRMALPVAARLVLRMRTRPPAQLPAAGAAQPGA